MTVYLSASSNLELEVRLALASSSTVGARAVVSGASSRASALVGALAAMLLIGAAASIGGRAASSSVSFEDTACFSRTTRVASIARVITESNFLKLLEFIQKRKF